MAAMIKAFLTVMIKAVMPVIIKACWLNSTSCDNI
jgi:hypothetical protein